MDQEIAPNLGFINQVLVKIGLIFAHFTYQLLLRILSLYKEGLRWYRLEAVGSPLAFVPPEDFLRLGRAPAFSPPCYLISKLNTKLRYSTLP